MYGTDEPLATVAELRPKLLAVAYRMLGSVADAEDAVQDAYVRYQQAENIASPEAWLVKTTTRLCIDRLRQAKRRETYVGPWLPEPVSNEWDGAAASRLELAESLSMAFLVLIETLSPDERAAFLLREVFNYDFGEIATLLDKTPVNVRQLTSRAKKRLEAKERRFASQAEEVNELATRFFDACQEGDIDKIESLLSRDIVLYSDGGGKVHAAPRPVHGPRRIAKLLSTVFRKLRRVGELYLTTVNGQPGAVFRVGGKTTEIFGFAADQGMVSILYAVLNPDKLSRWPQAPAADRDNVTSRPSSKGDDSCPSE